MEEYVVCKLQLNSMAQHGWRDFNSSQKQSTHSQWLPDSALIYTTGSLKVNISGFKIYSVFTPLGAWSLVLINVDNVT